MLRIRITEPDTLRTAVAPAAEAATVSAEIIRDFADPYLELVRLLREASEIEHALLVQYLYGAFSVKPAYPLIMGFGFPNSRDLLGVAVQEMQHLNEVNRMLGDLGAAPNLIRQDFPYEPDIYPFALNLEPLSLASLAKYTYTEASAQALDPEHPDNAGEREFLELLFGVLGDVRPNRLGSLYGRIIAVTGEVIAAALPGLPDLSAWPPILERIKTQGEDDHFRFFRNVFMGTHPGFGGRTDVWTLPFSDPAYPAVALPVNPSAFEGHPGQITDPGLREIAWLSDLHYWLILGLLDLGYRSGDPVMPGLAREHMLGPLYELGRHLASLGQGLPFDPLSMGYAPGADRAATMRVLRHLTLETQAATERLRDRLPADFSFGQTQRTLDALGASGRNGSAQPGTGGPPPPPPPPPPADATQFWFDLDDRFLFNVAPDIGQAYVIIRGPDFIRTRFNERRQTGTYPDGFIADVTPMRDGLVTISREQLVIFRRHFDGNQEETQRAFEDFGQGVLYDDRRPPGTKVHMMDISGPTSPPIGYHRWHAINRALMFLGIDADEWTAIDRLVGLAWAIHAEARPMQDTHNPRLPDARLAELRALWLPRTPDELDTAFDRFPFPPPS